MNRKIFFLYIAFLICLEYEYFQEFEVVSFMQQLEEGGSRNLSLS